MKWIVSELFLLALADCNHCRGRGVRREKRGTPVPCSCALRGVFRVCYARFRDCLIRGKYRSQVTFERDPRGRSARGVWCRKEEEYMADFELISRRALDPFHYRIFRYHFVLGADWKLCCRRLGVERGYFFHAVYRIEETLGKAFCETEPYALYPPSDYFVVRRSAPVEPCLPRDASREAGKVPRRLLARRADREQRLSA